MFRKFITAARREEGAALVEAAITLPIMLLVCIGILEFGRAYQAWQVVTNASREGARVAVLPGFADAAVEARVKTYLQNGALDKAADAGVVITNTTVDIGGMAVSAASVQVDYPFEFMVLQPIAELVVSDSTAGEGFTMTATTIMRNE